MMPAEDLLLVREVSKAFGGVTALDRLTLGVRPGKIVALIGANGAGKTTLFDVVCGLTRPDRGEVLFAGRSLVRERPHEIAQRGIGRTFQQTRLFQQMSVLQNVMLPWRYGRGESLLAALLHVREEDRRAREQALELLNQVGLVEVSHRRASELSHGQRKLLEIARCLALDPKLLLLDEPLAGLSPALVAHVKKLLAGLRKAGKTIVFIEHNVPAVMDISDVVIVLHCGRKLAEGSPLEVRIDPAVVKVFLGRWGTYAP
jgi:ABC-type branched-subunit amino acid transport system ATPase component